MIKINFFEQMKFCESKKFGWIEIKMVENKLLATETYDFAYRGIWNDISARREFWANENLMLDQISWIYNPNPLLPVYSL